MEIAVSVVLIVVALLIGLAIGFLIGTIRGKGAESVFKEQAAALKMQYDSAERGRLEAIEDADNLNKELRRQVDSHTQEMLQMAEQHKMELSQLADNHKLELSQLAENHKREIDEKVTATKEEVRAELTGHYDKMMQQMKENFAQTVATMKEEVRNSTKAMLEERQKEFADSSEQSLGRIIKPLQENIDQMTKTVKENTLKATDYSGQLKAGIESVLVQSRETMASAEKLANALSVGNKTQGNWGERILSELLESSGLTEGIHFETQEFIRDESGDRIKGEGGTGLQPDVILHIDKGHDVIIDAKVSLTAFLHYKEAANEEESQRYLKEHVASIRGQVKKLAKADYARYHKAALDYVIMFVPITQALYVATDADPHLWREAMEQKVYIADEQTLYAALKIISINWRQQAQAENQEKVFKLADEMLTRVRQFTDKFFAIGKALDAARSAYDDAGRKLDDKGQSIPVTCNKLVKLGAKFDKAPKLNQFIARPEDTATELPEE